MVDFLKEARVFSEELTKWRRYLHQHPEIGEDLPETKAFVLARLREMGLLWEEVDRSGILVRLGDHTKGKCMLVRCDMDALPVREETGLPFASENGNMHACGHDMHTVMLLGAARLLKAHESELNGCIKLLWQPAEEIMTGAQKMIDGGVLEAPAVDAAITIHCDCFSDSCCGDITVLNTGTAMSSNDIYRIEINGIGCHGAFPNLGTDPIITAAAVCTSLQEILAREVKAADQVVITQGSFHAGTVPNVIPEKAVLEGTVRTLDPEVRRYVKKRIEEITSGISQSYRCSGTVSWLGGCQPLRNDPELFRCAERYITAMLGEGHFINEHTIAYSSEDFSNYLDKIPGLQMFLVVGSMKDGAKYAMHSPHAVFDDSYLPVGASALAQVAFCWLNEHKELRENCE